MYDLSEEKKNIYNVNKKDKSNRAKQGKTVHKIVAGKTNRHI